MKIIRKEKMIKQGGRCYYCDLPMWENGAKTNSGTQRKMESAPHVLRCTAEHLHARSEGGKNTVSNIVAACWFCNSRRHRRKRPLPSEKYRQLVRERMAVGRWQVAAVTSRSPKE
nr:HNH endonuclease [Loktanella sp. SALINAS62]